MSTQSRGKLGGTCEELALDQPDGYKVTANIDKTAFSMWYVLLYSYLPDVNHEI